jgi:dCTP diphosphatase
MGFDLTYAAKRAEEFAKLRDWEQFHSLKNLSMALTGEIGELVEITQWMSDEEVTELLATSEGRARIEEEVADIAIYLVRIAQRAGIDLSEAVERKFSINEARYPVDTVRGTSVKYSERKS